MKNIVLIFATVVMLTTLSCSNDDSNGIELQDHDENQMMMKMHVMMDLMKGAVPTNDPEIDFAKMMIMHHQGAIDMANLEIQSGKNAEMKAKAQSIITEQQEEITELQNIVNGLTVDNSDPEFAMEQMESMNKMGTNADTQIITGDIDNDFATLMMVHHQAAIDNSSAYLHHGTNEELKTMANATIKMQTDEIIELGDWLIANRR